MSSLDQAFIRAYAKDRREVTADPKAVAPVGQPVQQAGKVPSGVTAPMTPEELAHWYRVDAPQSIASANAVNPMATSTTNQGATSKSSAVGSTAIPTGQAPRSVVAARRVETRGVDPTAVSTESASLQVSRPGAEKPMTENLVMRHTSHRLPPYPHLHELEPDADVAISSAASVSTSAPKASITSGNQGSIRSTTISPNDPPYTFVADTSTSPTNSINPSAPENLHGRRQTLASYLASQQAVVAANAIESRQQVNEQIAAESPKFTAVRPPHSHASVPAPHFLAPSSASPNAAVVAASAKPASPPATSAKKIAEPSTLRTSPPYARGDAASINSMMVVDTVDWTKQPFSNASNAAIVNDWSPLDIGVSSGSALVDVVTTAQATTSSASAPRASSLTEERKLDSHRSTHSSAGVMPSKGQDGPEILRGPHQRTFSRPTVEPLTIGSSKNVGSEKSLGTVKDKGIDRVDLPAQESKPKTASIEPLQPFQAVWEVDRLAWPEVCERLMEQQKTAFDAIGRHLQQSCREGLKVLAVTSPTRGEGRSTIAACLARSAAQRNLKVALVDGDMLHPSLSEHLNLEISRGWLDVIYGNLPLEEVAVSSIEDRLTLIPLTEAIEDSSLLPTDARISQMLHDLRSAFDLVVVDASHVHTVGGLMIGTGSAGGVDAAIVVNNLRNHDTARIEASVRRIRRMGIASVGIVENFVDA